MHSPWSSAWSRPAFQDQAGQPRVATVCEDEHGDLYMEKYEETKEVIQALRNYRELVDRDNMLELAEQYEHLSRSMSTFLGL